MGCKGLSFLESSAIQNDPHLKDYALVWSPLCFQLSLSTAPEHLTELDSPGSWRGARYLPETGVGGVCFSLLLSSVFLPSETPVGREADLRGQADTPLRPGEGSGGGPLVGNKLRCLPEYQRATRGRIPSLGDVLRVWWSSSGDRHLAFQEHPP